MKSTVEISEYLMRRAEAEAASQGLRVGEVIEEALRRGLGASASRGVGRVPFPLHCSAEPGSLTVETVRLSEESQAKAEDEDRAVSR